MTTNKDQGSGSSADDLTAGATEQSLGPNPFTGFRPEDILASARALAGQAVTNPLLLLEQEAVLARKLMSALGGKAELAPVQGDRRFQDPAWKDNPFYRFSLQGYLAWSDALSGFVDKSTLDETNKEKARFVVSLWVDALSPTNTLLGNPAALKKTLESGGTSLFSGLKNMLGDLSANKGMPSQVDKTKFEVGRNLAVAPGAVVFRNDVLELIQYQPTTSEVFERPHVIVPPQVNKFYVFDISPGKSVVEHLVKKGFQTFVVSWRNPTPAQRDWDMDTYVAALLEAIAAARDITGSSDVNLHGACSGAMTMTALLGHLAAKQEPLINAATMMVAVLDNSTESQLGLFTSPEIIAQAKRNSRVKGVLEGQEMGRVFAWMRPNDLVWNYWVNNYLMGNPPPVFDILYWNNDTTRLPAKFHGQLLDVFVDNLFSKPGALTILGTPIDISKVDCDKYILAGITDHITPWKGVYNTARLLGGKNDFILSSSGHVQSIINPPGNPKARFFVNPQLPETPDEWLAGAQAASGSWWEHWCEWLSKRSGAMRGAPVTLGSERYKPGAKAPGTFVAEP